MRPSQLASILLIANLGVWPQSASTSESGTWSTLVSPSARYGATAIRDPITNRMVLFGGAATSDVWVLPLGPDGRWQQLEIPGTQPPPRSLHTAIYDPLRRRMIVFGGSPATDSRDVWELPLDGKPEWRLMPVVGPGPGARWGHSAIYDPDGDQMIVFGGSGRNAFERPLENDVWALSLSTSAWRELTPGGPLPAPRVYAAVIHDPVRNRMLLFGGEDADGWGLNDLHELALTGEPVWSPMFTPTAPIAANPIAAYDAVADRMVVWGPDYRYESVLYSLALGGPLVWIGGPVPGPQLPARWQAGVFDPAGDRFVTFGGLDYGGTFVGHWPRDDTWEITFATSTMRRLFDAPPNPSAFASLVIDPIGNRGIYVGVRSQVPRQAETWQFGLESGGQWQELSTDGSAPLRAYSAVVFDSTRNRVLVFGGSDTAAVRNDTWALSLGTTPTWSALPVAGALPPPMYAGAAIDPVNDRMVVLGLAADPSRNELWALGLDESTWLPLEPEGDYPLTYSIEGMVYDPNRHRILVVPGYQYPIRIHALELAPTLRWSEVAAVGAPNIDEPVVAAFDKERDRLVVHDGRIGETWALSFAGPPAWTKLGRGPYRSAGAHDASGDRLIAVSVTHWHDQVPPATWQLQFGKEPSLQVGCPGTRSWSNPGTSLMLEYTIVNPSKETRFVEWTLASERAWPGFPMVGTIDAPGPGTVPVPVEFVVPDSAAIGLNRLRFSVREVGAAEDAWFCEHYIGDLATPVRVSALAPEILSNMIVLKWHVADSDGRVLVVERRENGSDWHRLGPATADGRDLVRYEDADVLPGRTYAYRLEVPSTGGPTWAGLIETRLPDISLSLSVGRVDPVAGSLKLEVELPAAGEVRLEIFDTSGRRIHSRLIAGWTRGIHTIEVDLGGHPAGIFFARLTHQGRSAIARFALLR